MIYNDLVIKQISIDWKTPDIDLCNLCIFNTFHGLMELVQSAIIPHTLYTEFRL